MSVVFGENEIFKYVPFSTNSLKILINRELWFGEPKNQNDPYEGEFTIKRFNANLGNEKKKELLTTIFKEYPKDFIDIQFHDGIDDNIFIKEYSRYMKELLRIRYGICSFTLKPLEVLMWSHYADSHRGYSLIFDKKSLIQNLKNKAPGIRYGKVEYKDRIPEITVRVNKKGYPEISGHRVFLFKYQNWHYEEEFRFIKLFDEQFEKNRSIKFGDNDLVGVIFGERMSTSNMKSIVNALSSYPNFREMNFFRTIRDEVTGESEIELLEERTYAHTTIFRDQGAKYPYEERE